MRSWQRNAAGYLSFVPYRRKAVRYPNGIMPYFNSAALEVPDFSRGRVQEEPVHAEREDGKEADYGYHPYADE